MGVRSIIDVIHHATGGTRRQPAFRLYEHWRDEGLHIAMLATWLRDQYYGGELSQLSLIEHAHREWNVELQHSNIWGWPGQDIGPGSDVTVHHELAIHTHNGDTGRRWMTLTTRTRARRTGPAWQLHSRADGIEQIELCAAGEMRARARNVRILIKTNGAKPHGWLTPEQYEHNAALHEAAWPRHLNPDGAALPTAQEAGSWA